jgi:hypothetical protein
VFLMETYIADGKHHLLAMFWALATYIVN